MPFIRSRRRPAASRTSAGREAARIPPPPPTNQAISSRNDARAAHLHDDVGAHGLLGVRQAGLEGGDQLGQVQQRSAAAGDDALLHLIVLGGRGGQMGQESEEGTGRAASLATTAQNNVRVARRPLRRRPRRPRTAAKVAFFASSMRSFRSSSSVSVAAPTCMVWGLVWGSVLFWGGVRCWVAPGLFRGRSATWPLARRVAVEPASGRLPQQPPGASAALHSAPQPPAHTRTHLDHRHAARQLGDALAQLLGVVHGVSLRQLLLDLQREEERRREYHLLRAVHPSPHPTPPHPPTHTHHINTHPTTTTTATYQQASTRETSSMCPPPR